MPVGMYYIRPCVRLLGPLLGGLQEVASLENDTEKRMEFQSQLDELEERAKELDQRRTNNISAVRLDSCSTRRRVIS